MIEKFYTTTRGSVGKSSVKDIQVGVSRRREKVDIVFEDTVKKLLQDKKNGKKTG